MNPELERETQSLIRSWARHDRRTLRDYLVADVEDPRINVQSILTRHFLAEQVFPGRFAALKDAELRFALTMNWLLGLVKARTRAGVYDAALTALLNGSESVGRIEHAEASPQGREIAIPAHVRETFARLPGEVDGAPVADYLTESLARLAAQADEPALDGPAMETMCGLWQGALASATEAPAPISVLEPACGSANDYRFLHAYGLARWLDYTGFDLCDMNVENAREMFPGVRFATGNVLAIAAADKSLDFTIVHDLFEHLSLPAMEAAVAEISRVTRRGMAIGFFNMYDGPEHVVRPVDEYYANGLSAPAMQALFVRHGAAAIDVVPIRRLVASRFPGATTHNREAYTFFVRF